MSRPDPERPQRRDVETPAAADRSGGVLVLAATPIGNAGDAGPRLGEELVRADVIAAEDTRRLPRLCAALGVVVSGRVVSLHDHNESSRIGGLIDAMSDGERVVLVTDAGMPTVSDPGFRLVRAAVAAGLTITCVPGPSAVLASLAVSGLPVDRFCFEGFPPRRSGERGRRLHSLASEQRTMVFFEAPHRLAETLAAMADAFGVDRAAAVCRELTKTHEEVRRGTLADLTMWASDHPVRGEVTVVIGGAPAATGDLTAAVADVAELVERGMRLKEACRHVGARTGVPVRELYAASVHTPPAGEY